MALKIIFLHSKYYLSFFFFFNYNDIFLKLYLWAFCAFIQVGQ